MAPWSPVIPVGMVPSEAGGDRLPPRDLGLDLGAMCVEERASRGNRSFAAASQARELEHATDRHNGLVQALQELDPSQFVRVVATMTTVRAGDRYHQSDAFVIAERVGRDARLLRDLADLRPATRVSSMANTTRRDALGDHDRVELNARGHRGDEHGHGHHGRRDRGRVLNARRHRGGEQVPSRPDVDSVVRTRYSTPGGIETASRVSRVASSATRSECSTPGGIEAAITRRWLPLALLRQVKGGGSRRDAYRRAHRGDQECAEL